ncbi:MAG: hypothetical protein K2K37_04605 [Muribaculaceae bacterium]|nr:hypothetical protein [Muribaculaceae bacterium]
MLLTMFISSYGQSPYGMGCLPEPNPESLPHQAELLTKDFESLPSRFSLEDYCPIPQSQGQYGTCTGWATAYAFRSILEAVRHGWTDKKQITNEAFSPLFLYARIKQSNDMNCSLGSVISDAFSQMKNVGVAKKNDFNHMCTSFVPNDIIASASKHKIANFTTIVNNGYFPTSHDMTIQKVKKLLQTDNP